MEQLSALDAMFAYTETASTPMHIGQMLIYDPSTAPGGAVGFKDILKYIEGRLDGARIFRQKLVRVPLDLDHPYWVDDENFDIEFHVRHIALPLQQRGLASVPVRYGPSWCIPSAQAQYVTRPFRRLSQR